jgi:uncharacterized protein YcgI (DUF1989 family)
VGNTILDMIIQPRGCFVCTLMDGQSIRITDLEGQQIPDVIALNAANPTEKLSMANTILINGRWNLKIDMPLYSTLGHRMLAVTADTVGHHFIGGGYCNDGANATRYGDSEGTRPTCRKNLIAALEKIHLGPEHVQPDMCLCPFMKYTYHEDGRRTYDCTASQAGDYLELRAEMDCHVAISNCPQELNNVNGSGPTALGISIMDA